MSLCMCGYTVILSVCDSFIRWDATILSLHSKTFMVARHWVWSSAFCSWTCFRLSWWISVVVQNIYMYMKLERNAAQFVTLVSSKVKKKILFIGKCGFTPTNFNRLQQNIDYLYSKIELHWHTWIYSNANEWDLNFNAHMLNIAYETFAVQIWWWGNCGVIVLSSEFNSHSK